MAHVGAPVELFGQMHQARPKLPARLVFLEDSSPSDAATGYQAQVQQFSAILSIKTRKMGTATH